LVKKKNKEPRRRIRRKEIPREASKTIKNLSDKKEKTLKVN